MYIRNFRLLFFFILSALLHVKCNNGQGANLDFARGQTIERDLLQRDQDLLSKQTQLQQQESAKSVLDYELARLREEVKNLLTCIGIAFDGG